MKISRREFVKSASGLAGIIAAGYAPSLYALGANDRVRVACVGYSDRFKGSLQRCFAQHSKKMNFDMVAVADLWSKRLYEKAVPEMEKYFGHKIVPYRSDVELYEKGAKDIDAVIISTADFQHAQHASRAVNAGMDVYAEKPLSEDMTSANILFDAVEEKRKKSFASGAVLQVGSQRRSGVAYHAAKEYLESGKLGPLTYVDLCWNVNQNRRWRKSEALVASLKKEDIDWNAWLLDRDSAEYSFDPRKYLEFRLFWPFSSGIPGQWMCHQIDTVSWYTGLQYPLSAVASGGIYAWDDGRQSFDTFTTILSYGPSRLNDKGFQAVFSSRQTNSARGNVEKYHGTKGTIDLCSGKWSNEGVERVKMVSEKLTANYAKAETAADTGADPLTSVHMLNWMECVRERKNPNAPVEAGHAHTVALVMSNAACRTGMKATYDAKTRQVIVDGKVWTGYKSTGKFPAISNA